MISKITRQLFQINIHRSVIATFSSDIVNINTPPAKYADHRTELKENIWRVPDVTGKRSQETHLSNAEQLIKQIPVLKVHSDVVRCMGGTAPGTGHPVVYIQTNTKNPGQPVSCKYCGLRYALDTHHHP